MDSVAKDEQTIVAATLDAYDEAMCDADDVVDPLEIVLGFCVEVLSHDGLEELVKRLYENHGVMLP